MKIIKKPNIKKHYTCSHCGTVVKLKLRDLIPYPYNYTKELWICPICKKRNVFLWEEELDS